MKRKHIFDSLLGAAGIILLIFLCLTPAYAQKKLQHSPGGTHGELDFPVSWKRYYTVAEWNKIMFDIQKKYPHLSDVQSIGKTRMGREQYLITITARSAGPDTDKPAMWVDGAVHGNEVNGITCSLYLMWYLLTRYDYDAYVHNLVNRCTFYILPGLNVDANESFAAHPNSMHNPREPFRPEDNDGDGLYDEDRTEDVDGDGEISVMYVEDPLGGLKLSADGRRFVDIEDPDEKVKRFRRVGQEGYDNDGDGLINEDDIGGPDPNRNYPFGWNLNAGNPYPMSEYCTRNVFKFQLAHPNIFAAFHYHNAGRLIMYQAPPAKKQSPQERERFQAQLKQQVDILKKENRYAYLPDREVDKKYAEDMTVQIEMVNRGLRILKNYTGTIGGLMGQAHAASYYMLGAYAYLMELWGSPAFDADEDGDGRVSEEETLKWIDIELAGEGWITPHKTPHPDLGEVWIGGTVKKHISRTPPSRYIEQEALKNAQYVMACANEFPKVEIARIDVNPVAGDLFWVEAVVENDRGYPTSSDRSVALERAVKDKLIVTGSHNVSLVTPAKSDTKLDPFYTRDDCIVASGKVTEFRIKAHEMLRIAVLVRLDGTEGWVECAVDSKHGGKDARRVKIRVGD